MKQHLLIRKWEAILEAPIQSVKPYRKNWLIQTPTQAWIAKKMEPSRLRWWSRIDAELRARGFHAMLPIKSDTRGWIFTPYIQATMGSYSHAEDVCEMMQTLAHFHSTGRELWTPPDHEAAFLLMHRLAERLKRFYAVLQRSSAIPGELGQLIRRYGKEFYLDGIRSYERLNKLPFSRFVWEERNRRSLAHRDLASHNWLWDRRGNLWLIDFETAEYDAQIGDVWQMASRVMAEQNGLSTWFDRAMAHYQRIRPLSAEERTYVALLLSFPNEFFREAIGLVERKRGYAQKASVPYLRRLGENRKRIRADIRNLFYW